MKTQASGILPFEIKKYCCYLTLKRTTYQRPESNRFYLSILFKKRFQYLNRRYYKYSKHICIQTIKNIVEHLLVRLVLHYLHVTSMSIKELLKISKQFVTASVSLVAGS